MKRNINTIKAIPSFKLKGVEKDDKEKKYKSDLEKPRKQKKEVNKDEIKYFIHL
jgi:hypothetical protein